jgi:CRISPR-associated protein Cmx8
MLDLEYDLFALPTAQHKAGLAGMLLLHHALERRGVVPLPEVGHVEGGRVTVKLDEKTLQALVNEVYDGAMVEKPQETKRKDKDKNEVAPVRTYQETVPDRKTGKEKTVTKFVYEDLRPRGQALKDLGMPEIWLKLWQDALWSTLRGIPKTRTPYEERRDGKDVNEGAKLWGSLQRAAKERAKGHLFTEDISSSVFLGAQAANPEKVSFVGRPEENLLLHFWPLVARVFVPEVVNREGKSDFKGFVFAIPEVADMEGFLEEYPQSVSQLGAAARGYVPAEAIITLPEEGALEYARTLHALARARAQADEVAFTLTAVDIFSLEKQGNSIRTLSAGRVPVRRSLLAQYEAVRMRYRHPVFMAQVLRNLLRGQPLYQGFSKVFETGPQDWFLGGGSHFPRCARDLMKDLSEPRA